MRYEYQLKESAPDESILVLRVYDDEEEDQDLLDKDLLIWEGSTKTTWSYHAIKEAPDFHSVYESMSKTLEKRFLGWKQFQDSLTLPKVTNASAKFQAS